MRRDKKVLLAAVLGATVMTAPSVSMAQARGDTGWYAGITLGQSDAKDVDCGGFSCDKKDTAFRILGGYQINRNFAEVGRASGRGKVTFRGLGVRSNVQVNVWELGVIRVYQIVDP